MFNSMFDSMMELFVTLRTQRPNAQPRWLHALLLSLACLSVNLTSPASYADDADEQRAKQRFSAYKQQAMRLQTSPQARYLVSELSDLNQWIGQAERELAEDEEERFMRFVDLIQVQLQLIDVSVEELIARERVEAVEREGSDLEAKAKQEREAIVELERRLGGVLTTPKKAPQAQPARAPTPAPAPAPLPAPSPAPSPAPAPAP